MDNRITKTERIAAILFLIVGALTVMEYVFVRGMFTAPIMIALSILAGVINVAAAAVHRKWMNVLFFILLTVALNMGYFTIGGY